MVCTNGLFTLNEAVAIGLYFTVIGYKFLLFGYFLLIRFRKTKRMYWLYFSLFFIFLAASRVFYLLVDFFFGGLPEILLGWKLANMMAWVAVAMLSGILSTLLFTGDSKLHQVIKKVFPIIPIGIAVYIMFLPDIWINDTAGFLGWGIGKLILNGAILPVYIVLLPFMFFYLAKRSAGTLQRSFLFNGIGLLLYYVVRAIQPAMGTESVWPPLLILLAILIITFANQYENLK
jgi:hypothetical protein